jgi:hypothetical protein
MTTSHPVAPAAAASTDVLTDQESVVVFGRASEALGSAELTVEGRLPAGEPAETDGSDSVTVNGPKVLPLTEIAEGDSYPLKFRFRYFQDLSGTISLPRGFEPERIVVRAGKRGASTQPLSRTFDWTVAG